MSTSSSIASDRTHRCRLYRVNEGIMPGGKHLYAEVWDAVEFPYPKSHLPAAPMVHEVSASSVEEVRAQMTDWERDNDVRYVGDWRSRGSI